MRCQMHQTLPSALRLAATPLLGAVLSVPAAIPAFAQSGHGAHEHGHGTLNIVLDGEELAIELLVPGVNVVGFEHRAESDEDRAAVAKAVERFSQADGLFNLPGGAGCDAEEANARLGETEDGHPAEGDGHQHGSEEKSGARQKHGTEKEHGHDKEDAAEHSELHATYRFHCHHPSALDQIQVDVFDHLEVEEIRAQVVSASGQQAIELTDKNRSIALKP